MLQQVVSSERIKRSQSKGACLSVHLQVEPGSGRGVALVFSIYLPSVSDVETCSVVNPYRFVSQITSFTDFLLPGSYLSETCLFQPRFQ